MITLIFKQNCMKPRKYKNLREAMLAAWDIGVNLVSKIETPEGTLALTHDVWRH